MKNKHVVGALCVAVGALAAGCASVDVAQKLNGQQLTQSGTSIAHLNGSNWGIYWLKIIPIFTGSTDHPGQQLAFKDTVRLDTVVDMTTASSKALGATKTTDLQSHETSVLVFPLPPFLFWYKAVEVSGNAIK